MERAAFPVQPKVNSHKGNTLSLLKVLTTGHAVVHISNCCEFFKSRTFFFSLVLFELSLRREKKKKESIVKQRCRI